MSSVPLRLVDPETGLFTETAARYLSQLETDEAFLALRELAEYFIARDAETSRKLWWSAATASVHPSILTHKDAMAKGIAHGMTLLLDLPRLVKEAKDEQRKMDEVFEALHEDESDGPEPAIPDPDGR